MLGGCVGGVERESDWSGKSSDKGEERRVISEKEVVLLNFSFLSLLSVGVCRWAHMRVPDVHIHIGYKAETILVCKLYIYISFIAWRSCFELYVYINKFGTTYSQPFLLLQSLVVPLIRCMVICHTKLSAKLPRCVFLEELSTALKIISLAWEKEKNQKKKIKKLYFKEV